MTLIYPKDGLVAESTFSQSHMDILTGSFHKIRFQIYEQKSRVGLSVQHHHLQAASKTTDSIWFIPVESTDLVATGQTGHRPTTRLLLMSTAPGTD